MADTGLDTARLFHVPVEQHRRPPRGEHRVNTAGLQSFAFILCILKQHSESKQALPEGLWHIERSRRPGMAPVGSDWWAATGPGQ